MASMRRKALAYFKGWNIFDLLGCLLFILGFILKTASLRSSVSVFIWARYVKETVKSLLNAYIKVKKSYILFIG